MGPAQQATHHLPGPVECQRLLAQMQMPEHILAHSLLVCRVALCLTDRLARAGVALDRPLVQAAAILHDITKPRSFRTGEDHARTGGEYLTSIGLPRVGDIVRQHVVLDAYFADDHPNEAEVVNYADKRVLHDSVVPLDDRMNYILVRYAKTDDMRRRLHVVWRQTERLEQRLFGYVSFSPLELADHLFTRPAQPDGLQSI